jgi:4-hydroxyphenylpyruvate dioxygenase
MEHPVEMKISISQSTTLSTPLEEELEALASGGWQGVEIWLTKLEKHLENHSSAETKRLFEAKQLTPVAGAYQGGLLLSQGEQRKLHFDHFKRRLRLCEEFAIPTLLVVADFVQRIDQVSLERAIVSLKQAAQFAAAVNVTLALEFRGADSFCSNLDTALTLVEQCDEPNVGINLDLFHYYKGPSKPEDLDRLTKQNLAFVQLSDVIGVPRELMTDSDRVLPGEGDFRLEPILQMLKRIDYPGWVSLELFNPLLWEMKPSQVSELAYTAMSRLFES